MDFTKKAIDSIGQAKEYFKEMGCSHFHMSREYPERYDEYINLNILKSVEIEWSNESVNELFEKIHDPNTKKTDLWWLHSRLEDLVQFLKTVEVLQKIFKATEFIIGQLPNKDKLLVAETINGRSEIGFRSGLIFLAYDLKEKIIARRLAVISTDLINSAKERNIDQGRCDRAMSTCNKIKKKLGLS
ncbi:MAG: hypothetical protein JW927_19170 [Deltaproteobacteria bacterium]|nr:hypothetical protein [Deltaproteobacteria bacterium]